MISSFKSFLVEDAKVLYVVWGRMNPPTAGHEKLLDFAKQQAGKNPLRIYLTQSVDSKKNPLDYATKIKFARKGFPKHARQIMMDVKLKTIFDAMVSFYDEGFRKIVVIAGEDRVREYGITLSKYNGKKARHGFYNFENIEILNAGKRDPDAKGVEGVSGTKLRKYATDGDFSGFAQFMPKALSTTEAKEIFNAVRKGMGLDAIKEYRSHVQLKTVSEIRESYINGELFIEGDTVVIKETGELAKIKTLGSNYVIIEGSGNQYRKWLDAVEKVDDPSLEYETADFSVKSESLSESAAYHKGLSKSTIDKRKAQFKKQTKMDDDNPAAYKPAPGDKTAKTKPSKHTIRFKQMYGEQSIELTKDRIQREKEIERKRDAADKKRHDSMMDRARSRKTRRINRRTNEA